MEKIEEQLQTLPHIEVPRTMHTSVMKKINYHHFRTVILLGFCLLTLSFIIFALRINSRLVDAEFADAMNDFINAFDPSFSFFSAVLGSFFEIVSPALVIGLLVSFTGACYLGKKITFYQWMKL
jgi:hypothetical protein